LRPELSFLEDKILAATFAQRRLFSGWDFHLTAGGGKIISCRRRLELKR